MQTRRTAPANARICFILFIVVLLYLLIEQFMLFLLNSNSSARAIRKTAEYSITKITVYGKQKLVYNSWRWIFRSQIKE